MPPRSSDQSKELCERVSGVVRVPPSLAVAPPFHLFRAESRPNLHTCPLSGPAPRTRDYKGTSNPDFNELSCNQMTFGWVSLGPSLSLQSEDRSSR